MNTYLSAPTANTTLGLVAGAWLSDGTAQYLGLQYATAERWQIPVDRTDPYASRFAFDAASFGPSCPQGPGQIYNSSDTSEECLYINVWTPPNSRGDPAPVLLWIHGGGYMFGGAAPFNGSTLAAQQDVVVCTINYRLGYLGFMAFPEDRDRGTTGNWGLLDQQSAMRWVRRQARSFGGDPGSVTLFGQSAGASCVLRHLASPASRGLFHTAIAESGAAKGDFSLEYAVTKTLDAAGRLGCAGHSPALRACLSARSVTQLLAAQAQASTPPPSHPLVDVIVSPVIDGVVLMDDTLRIFGRGAVARVPLLIGANTNEANLFVAAVPAYANMSAGTYAGFVNASLYLNNQTPAPGRLARVLAAYPPTANATTNLRRFAQFATDAGFVCSARETAAALRRRPQPPMPEPVFFYHYDHPYPNPRCADLYFEPGAFGTTHTAEISYVFGQPTYVFGRPMHPERCAFDASEAAFARQVGSYWASFARHGRPSPDWPVWDPPGGGGTRGDVDAMVKLKRVDGRRRPRPPVLTHVSEAETPASANGVEIEHGWRAAKCAEIES